MRAAIAIVVFAALVAVAVALESKPLPEIPDTIISPRVRPAGMHVMDVLLMQNIEALTNSSSPLYVCKHIPDSEAACMDFLQVLYKTVETGNAQLMSTFVAFIPFFNNGAQLWNTAAPLLGMMGVV